MISEANSATAPDAVGKPPTRYLLQLGSDLECARVLRKEFLALGEGNLIYRASMQAADYGVEEAHFAFYAAKSGRMVADHEILRAALDFDGAHASVPGMPLYIDETRLKSILYILKIICRESS
ncbi:MAG TPA: hypothetical protein VMF62_12340 [Acetobacteraceae bacterium]|nr:hypothetical protein [Acetobacteraceae bacterium]